MNRDSASRVRENRLHGLMGGRAAFAGHRFAVISTLLIAESRKQGVRVPEDCVETGLDGVVLSPGEMQVTSVRVPYRDMGVTAVTRLFGRRAVMSSPRRHILSSPEFLAGKTTRPVGGGRA